jgi:3-methyladenine DNA glycosylase AlkD
MRGRCARTEPTSPSPGHRKIADLESDRVSSSDNHTDLMPTRTRTKRSSTRAPAARMRATGTATAMRIKPILAQLRKLGSERNRAGMARYGINVDDAFGVSVSVLRAIATRIGTDHGLALALWATGNHEARLLACFVDDPARVTRTQMEAWARDFDSWDLCDQATTSLFDRTEHGWQKAVEWAKRDAEWVRRAGFALMAGLAVHDTAAGDRAFVRLLPLIARAAPDGRNFVKKAVNWALRNIGKRDRALNAAAIACAKRILAQANARSGNDEAARSARWVAADALRELGSEAVRRRIAPG